MSTLILAVGNDLKNLWPGDPLYLIQYIYINDKINTTVFPFIVNNLTVFLPRLTGTMTGTGRRGMPRDLSDMHDRGTPLACGSQQLQTAG